MKGKSIRLGKRNKKLIFDLCLRARKKQAKLRMYRCLFESEVTEYSK